MRILLIEPSKAPATIGGEDVFIYEPLALAYVAAGVAEDHDVQILDLRIAPFLGGYYRFLHQLRMAYLDYDAA